MRVTVRRPGRSTQPVTRVRKRAEDGLVNRSVKRPSRRSHSMMGESSGPGAAPAGDAEDIVSKSAPPWIGRRATVPTGAPPPSLLHPHPPVNASSAARPTDCEKCESPPAESARRRAALLYTSSRTFPRSRRNPGGLLAVTNSCTSIRMTDEELKLRVLALRAQGRSGKEIARALRVRPATVAALVRTIARREVVAAPEPAVVGCWVSPGWRAGLTVEGHPDWPDEEGADSGAAGLVAVLVAREHRYGKVTVCGYLVDVYCLGVKDVVGPRAMHERELSGFVERYYEGYPSPPLAAPIDLARHLAWGAVEYARTLGFEPAHGFNATAAHLGPLTESSAIRFGRDGRPLYVQGPHDDAAR